MKLSVSLHIERKTGFVLDISFECSAQTLGVVGPSGSGKSSLLDCIAGVEHGGAVMLDGIDYSKLPLHKRDVGYVTQDTLLFPHLTVRDNLRYSPRAQAIEETAKALGIDGLLGRMPRHLSGGERKRVALARALASRPHILLLDEPFGGLDEVRRLEALHLLSQVRRQYSIPMILVSHRADDLHGNADWVICLEHGKVAASGAVYETPQNSSG